MNQLKYVTTLLIKSADWLDNMELSSFADQIDQVINKIGNNQAVSNTQLLQVVSDIEQILRYPAKVLQPSFERQVTQTDKNDLGVQNFVKRFKKYYPTAEKHISRITNFYPQGGENKEAGFINALQNARDQIDKLAEAEASNFEQYRSSATQALQALADTGKRLYDTVKFNIEPESEE